MYVEEIALEVLLLAFFACVGLVKSNLVET